VQRHVEVASCTLTVLKLSQGISTERKTMSSPDLYHVPAPARLPHCTIAARMLIPFRDCSSKFRFMHFVISIIPFMPKSPQSNATSDIQVKRVQLSS
jgi:hypothetical protein